MLLMGEMSLFVSVMQISKVNLHYSVGVALVMHASTHIKKTIIRVVVYFNFLGEFQTWDSLWVL